MKWLFYQVKSQPFEILRDFRLHDTSKNKINLKFCFDSLIFVKCHGAHDTFKNKINLKFCFDSLIFV